MLLSKNNRTCKRNPVAMGDINFVNKLRKSYLGIAQCPYRRQGKHVALKLILVNNNAPYCPFPAKLVRPIGKFIAATLAQGQ